MYTVINGVLLAPPPLECTGRGCYTHPRGDIEYYMGIAGVNHSNNKRYSHLYSRIKSSRTLTECT